MFLHRIQPMDSRLRLFLGFLCFFIASNPWILAHGISPSNIWLQVIDLLYVSPELAQIAQETDLVVLEGMGRAIETNLHAQFTCDSLKLGMVKHPEVAQCLGGGLYDVVCKFDVAPAT
ncbi:hypothetical protein CYMTET_42897 [Cymbomonas tetramitiformis]|uniref:Damage-control phosphatase ARMT1-like metal-binding domain-containing protein n=1 Tax=Cymbomonas tetramitiformis TaxID=36881 RepID=A0AAE0C346_9CHLO|nr:hypothetical protein CYMTET_42897 [Cymbomonas tetramitiformis]